MPDVLADIRIDVSEDGKSYEIGVHMPGLKKEDIKVSIDGRQVMIGAITRRKTDMKAETSLYAGRYQGHACRSFALPQEVDRKSARVRYESGVVSLTLQKKSNASSHRIADEPKAVADPGRAARIRGIPWAASPTARHCGG